jgi:prepilin-type N-terminal cleavage/methylation domain-containing protein
MKPSRRRKRSGGFTLIEVIAALVVFSAGVLMVLGLTGVLSQQLNLAGLRSRVAVVVQERLDSMRLVPYDSLTLGTVSDTVMLQGRTFNRTLRVFQTTPLVREVEITVVGADGSGPRMTSSTFVLRPW